MCPEAERNIFNIFAFFSNFQMHENQTVGKINPLNKLAELGLDSGIFSCRVGTLEVEDSEDNDKYERSDLN